MKEEKKPFRRTFYGTVKEFEGILPNGIDLDELIKESYDWKDPEEDPEGPEIVAQYTLYEKDHHDLWIGFINTSGQHSRRIDRRTTIANYHGTTAIHLFKLLCNLTGTEK